LGQDCGINGINGILNQRLADWVQG
jgi:hypothetical protein